VHFLIAIGIIAALIGFAFGENAARAFVGVLLGVGALAILGVISLGIIGLSR